MLNEYYGERKLRHPECFVMLQQAKAGDKLAEEQLIRYIKDKLMVRRIGRYLGRNRQVDNEDIKQEFLIGVGLAIKDVDMGMGDPVEYIINRGIYKVRSYVRKHIVQGTLQFCKDCGDKSRLNRVGTGYKCKKCGSTNVETHELEDKNDLLLDEMQVDGFEDELVSELVLSGFKETLTPGTNVYLLYEMLIEKQINRMNPQIDNFHKAIADEWGCSVNNVKLNMDKLKSRLSVFLRENQLDCCVSM